MTSVSYPILMFTTLQHDVISHLQPIPRFSVTILAIDEVCFTYKTDQCIVGPGLQKRSVPFKVQDWRLNKGERVDASAL